MDASACRIKVNLAECSLYENLVVSLGLERDCFEVYMACMLFYSIPG